MRYIKRKEEESPILFRNVSKFTAMKCWCGNSNLVEFSTGYLKCPECESLISVQTLNPKNSRVSNDDQDFYGKEYWFSHQEKDFGYPNITLRAKLDLPERCLYWLRVLLKYRLPPGEVLELGSMHGGFVALLNWAGFSASGLELSPWVAQFARETFHIPTLLGPIEEQSIEPGTLDVIAMMDVLEHFPNPIRTMKHCLTLIKKNGILIIQTPQFPEAKSHESMVARGDRFLEHLKENEHLYLFSQRSVREFFHRLGADHLIFETPIFSHYDMFFVASQTPILKIPPGQIEDRLRASPQGRMVQALTDLQNEVEKCKGHLQECEGHLQECEADRAARLEAIHELTRLLHEPLSLKLWRKFRELGK